MFIRVGVSDLLIVLRNIGHLLEYSSLIYIIPLVVAVIFRELTEVYSEFLLAIMVSYVLGLTLRRVFYTEDEPDLKHAFLITAFFWLIFVGIAAIPFYFNGADYLDAYFESMSSTTTTGLTVMKPLLDSMPASVIFWRSLLSWVGGIGIIVMALLGLFTAYSRVGKLMIGERGRQFLKPNLKNSIALTWKIYILLTIIGIVMLYASGMSLFQAVNYCMSAISTGGMDTTAGGLAAVNNGWVPEGLHNYWVDISLIIIMCFGAISFGAHYLILKKRNFGLALKDAEFRALMLIGFGSAIFIIPKLGIESSFFHVFSSITGGGFAIVSAAAVSHWDDFVKLILIALMFIGGSSGSTAGGIKISRFIILAKSVYWRMKKAILPERSFFVRKFEDSVLEERQVKEVLYYTVFYLIFIFIGVFVLTFVGHNLPDALFEVVSAQGNAGISAGISTHDMNVWAEIVLIFNMWVGRLELIPFFAIIGFLLSFRLRGK